MDESEFWAKWTAPQKRKDGLCPKCKLVPRVAGDSYCRPCRRGIQRAWMKANRRKYAELTEAEKVKARCRSYTRVLVLRGQLQKGPCSVCGGTKRIEAHHTDYTNPRLVIWKCRWCRRREHRQKEQAMQVQKKSEAKDEWDGKPIPPERWGRDHFTTLLYVETVCVDGGGQPRSEKMRSDPGRPRRGVVDGRIPPPSGRYPTRLKDGELWGHDDWDCVSDMEHAGLLEWDGTGLRPIIKLTDYGWLVAGALRRLRAGGGHMDQFALETVRIP